MKATAANSRVRAIGEPVLGRVPAGAGRSDVASPKTSLPRSPVVGPPAIPDWPVEVVVPPGCVVGVRLWGPRVVLVVGAIVELLVGAMVLLVVGPRLMVLLVVGAMVLLVVGAMVLLVVGAMVLLVVGAMVLLVVGAMVLLVVGAMVLLVVGAMVLLVVGAMVLLVVGAMVLLVVGAMVLLVVGAMVLLVVGAMVLLVVGAMVLLVVGAMVLLVVGAMVLLVVGATVELVVGARVLGVVVQVGRTMMLVSRLTAPPRARSRPATTLVPVCAVTEVNARMVPAKVVLVPSVAELPTCQKTLHAWASPSSSTVLFGAVVSVDPAWKMNTAEGSPCRVQRDGPGETHRGRGVVHPGIEGLPPRSEVTAASGARPAASL